MLIKPDQLTQNLAKGLKPVYLLTGDEPLQMNESADAIRKSLRSAGYTEREVLSVQGHFNWHDLHTSAHSLSLFDDKKIIDLRLSGAGPGVDGGKALIAYTQHLPDDTVLLITVGKLDKKSMATQWFKSLEKVGVVVQIWPLEGQDLLRWLGLRLQQRGFIVDQACIRLLAERIEGNLLAAAQEIEKLYILYGAGQLTSEQILSAVSDNARYDVFNLMDTLLAGQIARSKKMLNSLQSEGIAAPIVLWALAREARLLSQIKQGMENGQSQSTLFNTYRVWDKRKALVSSALQRLNSADIQAVLLMCAQADRQIKGQEKGSDWETLWKISLLFVAFKMPENQLIKLSDN